MSNKTVGANAKELVLFFYEKTGLKYTNTNIMVAVKNAKALLNAGYTFDEIKETIEYCCDNQPDKGIYSFGFISYEINKVQALLKSKRKQEIREEAISKSKFNDYGLKEVSNKDKIKEREFGVDTSIFD